jgi:Tol biopolymer transport system component
METGQQLGGFRIARKLGQGGMGEVWQATDARLGRDVALKLLPEDFAAESERHARFEREAKLLASLNHPNIATLHGLEHLDGRHVLVMELVDGEGLDERIARGAVPAAEAVEIARQIALALEAAHQRGVVHRDLKPANVKVRPDGTVKVLDFGLAKTWDAVEGSDLAYSPTITRAATAAGLILGTAAYMAPEQARGGTVDQRADIWAFGVVLWEMLTGRQLFREDTVSDTLAAVLREPIDLDALPADTPRAVRRLLRRCLARDPRERLHDIADARLELAEAAVEEPTAVPATTAPKVRARPWAWIGAAGVLALATLALGGLLWRSAHRAAPVVHAAIPAPAGATFNLGGTSPGPVAVSPDGRRLAFTARDEKGATLLWVRDLADVASRPLAGTSGAAYPFWSADSRRIGYFSGGRLRRIDAGGGPPLTLCDASNGKGGAWNAHGDIVFAPTHASALYRVAEAGGDATPVTTLDEKHGEISHRHPRFLPDGTHFLFLARAAASGANAEKNRVMVGSLGGGPPRELMHGLTNTEFASGHLLFVRESNLMAQPFDASRLAPRGDPFPVAEEISVLTGASFGVFSASANGVLAYQTGNQTSDAVLTWKDRTGADTGVVGEAATYVELSLSPDGGRAAATIVDPEAGTLDVWIWDVARGIKTRFTFSPGDERAVAWSRDGRRLAYSSERGGHFDIFVKDVEGGGDETLVLTDGNDKYPSSWTPDGRTLVFSSNDGKQYDLCVVPLTEGGKPEKLLATGFDEAAGALSPDGRWLAYQSNESGRYEVYVTFFPRVGRRWQVSLRGGTHPRWRRDGRELYYVTEDGEHMAAAVDGAGGTFVVGQVTKLFDGPYLAGPYRYDVAADGKRFLVVAGRPLKALPPMNLVLNWPAGIERR